MTSPLEAIYEAMYAIIVAILGHRWAIQMLALDGHMSECLVSRLTLSNRARGYYSPLYHLAVASWLIAISETLLAGASRVHAYGKGL